MEFKLGKSLKAAIGAQALEFFKPVEDNVTRWPEFQSIPKLLEGKKKQPLVVDGRRMLDSGSIERYTGIGM